jgi:hypothetical protein
MFSLQALNSVGIGGEMDSKQSDLSTSPERIVTPHADEFIGLMTEREAARKWGLKPNTLRGLRCRRAITFIAVAGRPMYCNQHFLDYKKANEVAACHATARDQSSSFLPSGVSITSGGTNAAKEASEARARQISIRLRQRLRPS